jgi:hypothetical protein
MNIDDIKNKIKKKWISDEDLRELIADMFIELDSKDKDIRELKEVLYDVITQFGFHNSSKGYYYTGGLSTIENIFCILGYEDIVKDSEIKEYFENLAKEEK